MFWVVIPSATSQKVLFVNEWLANSGPGSEDWIEIYNNSTTVDYPIGNYFLTDDPASTNPSKKFKYQVPDGQVFWLYMELTLQIVPKGGYWTINQFNKNITPFFGSPQPQGIPYPGFGLSALVSSCSLFPNFFQGESSYGLLSDLGTAVDLASFEGSYLQQTIGRWILSTGASRTALLSRPTKGNTKNHHRTNFKKAPPMLIPTSEKSFFQKSCSNLLLENHNLLLSPTETLPL